MFYRQIVSFFLLLLFSAHVFAASDRTLYFMQHPARLKAILSHCQSLGGAAYQNAECASAIASFQTIVPLTRELQANPQKFGQRIMAAQTRLSKLKAQLKTASIIQQSGIESAIKATKHQIALLHETTNLMGE